MKISRLRRSKKLKKCGLEAGWPIAEENYSHLEERLPPMKLSLMKMKKVNQMKEV
jgi:hypothetical protein